MSNGEVNTPGNWAELLEWRSDYPAIIEKWLSVLSRLLLRTKIREDDELGDLIVACMFASHRDINDLMTLSHYDSPCGAQYCLRALFERTVTLKYLCQNPERLRDFKDYDAVDWEQILNGIHRETGLEIGEVAKENLSNQAKAVRDKKKQEKCPECGTQRTSWTSLDTKSMSQRVGLEHLYLFGFTIPSKYMHPTLWGTRDRFKTGSMLYNTLHCMHHLLVETLLIHRRHFIGRQYLTPIMGNVILDYLKVFVFSQTSFDGALTRGEEQHSRRIYYGF